MPKTLVFKLAKTCSDLLKSAIDNLDIVDTKITKSGTIF